MSNATIETPAAAVPPEPGAKAKRRTAKRAKAAKKAEPVTKKRAAKPAAERSNKKAEVICPVARRDPG